MKSVSPAHAEAAARFWPKVRKTDGCWLWGASKYPKGYGMFRFAGRPMQAHRFAYELVVGPIPDGLQIDHLCRVRHCVNPSHLEAVSNRENTLRGVGATAVNAAKTHCERGHEFTPENTRRKASSPATPYGARQCRECDRLRDRTHRSRRR